MFHNNSAQVGGIISILDDSADNTKRNMVEHSIHDSCFLQPRVTFSNILDETECEQKEHSMIIVLDSVFASNYANYTGGVFNIENADFMTINESKFMNNIAYFGSGI